MKILDHFSFCGAMAVVFLTVPGFYLASCAWWFTEYYVVGSISGYIAIWLACFIYPPLRWAKWKMSVPLTLPEYVFGWMSAVSRVLFMWTLYGTFVTDKNPVIGIFFTAIHLKISLGFTLYRRVMRSQGRGWF